MANILLVIHIMAAVSMIVIILLQRSEGGALGIGGGGGGFVSGRGAADLLTRITAILAAIFFTTSITLGILSHRPAPSSAVGIGGPAKAPAGDSTPVSAPGEKAPETLPALKLPKLKPGSTPGQTTAPAAPPPVAPAAPAQPQLPQSQ